MLATNSLAFALDKNKHIIAGAIIGVSFTSFSNPKVGSLASCSAGLGKEIYDATGRGTPDVNDFAFTCASGVLSSYILYYIKEKIK